MSITFTTDRSGRHALVSVSDDAHSAAALIDFLPALRWTATDDIVVDLSRLGTIDLRTAVVLAQAKRHHDELGRRLAIACRPDTDVRALQAVGLDLPGVLFRSLADTGWLADASPRQAPEAAQHRRAPRVSSPSRRTPRGRELITRNT